MTGKLTRMFVPRYDKIISVFTKTLDQLLGLVTALEEEAKEINVAVESLEKRKADAYAEATKAAKTAEKIKELLAI